MIFYAIGGQQKPDAHQKAGWAMYSNALIVRVDGERGTSEICVDYRTPAELCPNEDASILFTAATVVDDRIYVCTKTEVLIYSLPDFQQVEHLSIPWFNDLHHVQPTGRGTLYVANTGLDAVLELGMDGVVYNNWSVIGEDPWARFDPDVDYRKVPTTKPHRSHPNYVFMLGGRPWVTRLQQKDAVCLEDSSRRIDIGVERPHDGVVRDGAVYFTTVDGHLVRASADSHEIEQVWDLRHGGLRRPGWCRGLDVLPNGLALVGFTRLRLTQWSENLGWLKGGINTLRTLAHRPARAALYDLEDGSLVREHAFDDVPLSAIFSVHVIAT